jgi:hypothetical protein
MANGGWYARCCVVQCASLVNTIWLSPQGSIQACDLSPKEVELVTLFRAGKNLKDHELELSPSALYSSKNEYLKG